MRLTFRNKRWEFLCKFESHQIPKAAGFRWDATLRVWYTQDNYKAESLLRYADDIAKKCFQVVASRKEKIAESRSVDASIPIPVPDGLRYLGYQRAGIALSQTRKNMLIADEMGLGKTIQALGIINLNNLRNVLIVCPASLKLNWEREASKWLVDESISIHIVDSKFFPRTANVCIINYDIVGKHKDAILARPWDLLICDEAHYLKNPKAQRTRAVLGGGRKRIKPIPAARKVFLTGTPIVNRPVELWPIVRALDPVTWDSWKYYTERYCAAANNGFGLDVNGASNLDEFQRKLRATVMIRRLKADVLTDLPPKSRQIIEIPAEGDLARHATRENDMWAQRGESIRALSEALTRHRISETEEQYRDAVQSLGQKAFADFAELSRIRHETAVAKIPWVIEHLKECLDSKEKIVLFAHHHDVIQGIYRAFMADSVLFYGEIPQAQRQRAVDQFQNDPRVRLFLGSITAAGVGITLTASSHVVFAELDWVPGNVTQAEDRCHRIGQQNNVLVQHIVLQNSIDARMARVIIGKQKIIENALNRTGAEETKPDARDTIKEAVDLKPIIRNWHAGVQGELFGSFA